MSDYNFEPMHKEMGHHIASGILNSGIVQVIKVACQLISVVVLSRLLLPSDFGLLAMAGPVFAFAALFQDLGLSPVTVQKPDITHDEINAFFWLNIGVGAALTIAVIAISPLVGWYYGEPRVVPLTIAMALLIIAGSLGNQHGAILTRRMQFGVMTLTGIVGAVSGLAISVIAALLLPKEDGYWALYLGLAGGNILPVIGVWMATGWRPTAPRYVPGLRKMLHFGAGVTTATIAGFLSGNMDNVLIGKRWGDQELGLYDRAYKLLLFPMQRVVSPVMQTLIPVLSRLNDDPDHYRAIFLKTIGQLTLAMWPGIIWAVLLDDTLITTVLGAKWAGAAPMFEPLAMIALLQTVTGSSGCMLISQGRAKELALWSVFGSAVGITAIVIGLPYGAVGVARALAICGYCMAPITWWFITRKGPVRLGDIIRAILPQIAGGVACAIMLLGYRGAVHLPPILFLAAGLVASYATAAAAMTFSPNGRDTLKQTIKAGRKIVGYVLTRNRNA